MAAWLKISRGGYFRKIFGQGGYTENTPLPPYSRCLHKTIHLLFSVPGYNIELQLAKLELIDIFSQTILLGSNKSLWTELIANNNTIDTE